MALMHCLPCQQVFPSLPQDPRPCPRCGTSDHVLPYTLRNFLAVPDNSPAPPEPTPLALPAEEPCPACDSGGCMRDGVERIPALTPARETQRLLFPEVTLPFDVSLAPTYETRRDPPVTLREFPSGAVRSRDAEGVRYDLISPYGLRRLAATCAEGARKYGDHNWLRGMPCSDLLNHALKHLYDYLRGDATEDHLAHAAWNIFACMHFEETRPDCCDLLHRLVTTLPANPS